VLVRGRDRAVAAAPAPETRGPPGRDTGAVGSEQHLRLLRRFSDAFNRHDLDAFLRCCDQEVEIVSGGVLIGTPTYRGREGVEQFFRDTAVAWEELQLEARDVVPIGADTLVIVGEAYGKGKTTGVPFRERRAALIRFAGGRVARLEFFATERDALEAAGASE
jgi:ketosteroid isomerase-like protein